MTETKNDVAGPGAHPLTRAEYIMLPSHAQKRLNFLEAALLAAEARTAQAVAEIARVRQLVDHERAERAKDAAEYAALQAQSAQAVAAAYEDAARVAEAMTNYDDRLQQSGGCATSGERIAAAIRARAAQERDDE